MPHHCVSPLGLCLLAACGKWHLFHFLLHSHARTPPVEDKGTALQPHETLLHPCHGYEVQVWSPKASEGPVGAGVSSIRNI